MTHTQSVNQSENGVALLLMLSTIGITIGLVAASIGALGINAIRGGEQSRGAIQAGGARWTSLMNGMRDLSERLQETQPITDTALAAMNTSNLLVGDEGGKLSLPWQAYAMTDVLKVVGGPGYDYKAIAKSTAAKLGLWTSPAPSPTKGANYEYYYLPPTKVIRTVYACEDIDEMAEHLNLSVESVRTYFTNHPAAGINVNTAPKEVLEGVIEWHRSGALTWADAAAPIDAAQKPIHLLPLPAYEPVMELSPAGGLTLPKKPDMMLHVTLPGGDWLPLAPGSSPVYASTWQFITSERKHFPAPSWVGGNFIDWAPPVNREYVSANWMLYPHTIRMDAWLPGVNLSTLNPAQAATAIIARRQSGSGPFAFNELTQAQGLMWVTPESWMTPHHPLVSGRMNPPNKVNVAASVAAFTGWVSVQGAGPYRATSDLYTLDDGVVRMTVRLSPNATPTIVGWRFDSP